VLGRYGEFEPLAPLVGPFATWLHGRTRERGFSAFALLRRWTDDRTA
jgi:hypothetical protein